MMLSFTLFTAIRFSNIFRKKNVFSPMSIISTFGIILGVIVIIVGLSAINGFERELNNRVLSIVPHAQIYTVNQPYHNWQFVEKIIQKTPGVLGVSIYINFIGILEHKSNLKAVQIFGISQKKQNQVSNIQKFILSNQWKNFVSGNKTIIIGNGIAKTLNVKIGDWITIMLSNNNSVNIQSNKRIRVHVIGILHLNGLLEHEIALIPIKDAQEYLNYKNSITGFMIKVSNLFEADKIAYNAGIKTMQHVIIKSWIDDYGYMYNDIQMLRSIIYLIMILIIGIACFNIVSTLIIIVKNKIKDIAILRSLGAKDIHIRAIFLWYGLLNGFISALIGIIIGVLISLNLTIIFKKLEMIIKTNILSSNIYFIDFLPSSLQIIDIIYVLITTIILSLLASLYPAHRANKLDPAQILR
ncbi:Lipoprotein-releasing system transmembrane protein LolE [Candidatus Providencia siddallii]|uniref:Lipoprotein-releasing system transmembrane protein LolE n=1 Tax=Candidatus Providencia siddallii TaxID=1715285 RepID=A0A0M6W7X3_9GAMM|nr:Lipoprotein-releasing system transmembrane protein LolE [Candidatus Providencia siddallii]